MATGNSKTRNYARKLMRPGLCAEEAKAVDYAIEILTRVHDTSGRPFANDPATVKTLLRLQMIGLVREEFHALWLDAQHRLIAMERLFVGTLTQTSVYPREVVRSGIAHNAAAVIVAHNHPSGNTQPSRADLSLTNCLKTALATVDISLLDHVIVGSDNAISLHASGYFN